MHTHLYRRLSFSLILLLCITYPAYSDDFYTRLNGFFRNSLPEEGFLATPYGADDRFAPKTIWIQVPNASGKTWRGNKQKAWIPLSSGMAVYTETLVPLKRRPIAVKTQQLDDATKLALAAAVTGKTQAGDIGVNLSALKSKSVDVAINLNEVEVEYGYYLDFLNAQAVNQHILAAMTDLLQKTFNPMPPRRVITGALRVKGATVIVGGAGAASVNADVALKPWLEQLGFQWNASRQAFESLSTGPEWKYIAYQSLLTDPSGKISSGDDTPAPSDFSEPGETGNAVTRSLFVAAAPPPPPGP